jgi:hypothetical protein
MISMPGPIGLLSVGWGEPRRHRIRFRSYHSAAASIPGQLPLGAIAERSATINLGAAIAPTIARHVAKIFAAAKRDPAIHAADRLCG